MERVERAGLAELQVLSPGVGGMGIEHSALGGRQVLPRWVISYLM